MRNVILAVVAIVALTFAGIGGVFADFNDIEVSQDNYFKTGSLDLAVSDYALNEYNGDDNIPAFIQYTGAWPCSDKSYFVDLENWGQGSQFVPWAYIHVKNLECCWVYPKLLYMWVDADGNEVSAPARPGGGDWVQEDQGTGFPKPVTEPEYVAEYGGIAGELDDGTLVVVDGIGSFGEGCELAEHIGVVIEVAGPWPHADKPPASLDLPWERLFSGKLSELECQQFELGQIPNCNGIWVHIVFHLQELPEEYFDENYFPGTDSKWNDWVTNAMQKDGVHFDMAFELLQNRAT